MPNSVSGISDISIEYLTRIYTPDNRPSYPFAHDLLKSFKASGRSSHEWNRLFDF